MVQDRSRVISESGTFRTRLAVRLESVMRFKAAIGRPSPLQAEVRSPERARYEPPA